MTNPFPVTVFHNPACGTSRNAIAMIEEAGYKPEIVLYLKVGWTRPQLEALMAKAGLSARELMREKGTPAAELGLLDPAVGDDALLEALVQHPILVNRPIVETPKGVKLCRPSEQVFDLLERRPARFVKEDGEVVKSDQAGG